MVKNAIYVKRINKYFKCHFVCSLVRFNRKLFIELFDYACADNARKITFLVVVQH